MDSISKKVLSSFLKHKTLSISQLSALHELTIPALAEIVNALRQKKLLRIEPNFAVAHELTEESLPSVNTPLEITLEGRAALEKCALTSKKESWALFRDWLAIGVAFAALIVSIIALILSQVRQ